MYICIYIRTAHNACIWYCMYNGGREQVQILDGHGDLCGDGPAKFGDVWGRGEYCRVCRGKKRDMYVYIYIYDSEYLFVTYCPLSFFLSRVPVTVTTVKSSRRVYKGISGGATRRDPRPR